MSQRDGDLPQGDGTMPRGGRSQPSIPVAALEAMDISKQVAVDGSPLQMDQMTAAPAPNPMPSNPVSPQVAQDILKAIAPTAAAAEFPIRTSLAKPNTTVFTNHFAMALSPNIQLFEYNIQGLPDRASKRTCRLLIEGMINAISFLRDNQNKFATDYEKKLISWVQIKAVDLGPVDVKSAERKSPIPIGLAFAGQLDTALLQQYAEGKIVPTKNIEIKVRWVEKALNMIISTALGQGSISLKANKFFVTGGHASLSPSLCAVRGYFYSVKPGQGQILLNLNSCTSAFYQPILVSDFLSDSSTWPSKEERCTQLRGVRVHLTYEPVTKGPRSRAAAIEARMKKVLGTGLRVDKQTFELDGRDGKPATPNTVVQHFKNTYPKVAVNPTLPAINCGTVDRPMWYPAETLQILPYQLHRGRVPDALTSAMLQVANRSPDSTRALIEHEGLKMLGLVPGEGLTRFVRNLKFFASHLILTAVAYLFYDRNRLENASGSCHYPCLSKPMYGNGGVNLAKSDWDLRPRKLLITHARASFKCFMIVVPDGQEDLERPKYLEETWSAFQKASKTYSTGDFSFSGRVLIDRLDATTAKNAMDEAQAKGANYIILFLGNNSIPSYSIIKDLADRTYGMQSSCVVYKGEGKDFDSKYWANVMMKVNLKTGGVNHTVAGIADVMKDTLVLGADVTHPGRGSLFGTPSIAAVVGSVDQTGGKFLGSLRLQPREIACEDIQDLEGMVLERVKAWCNNNKGQLPKNILYYRDGVSDTQYSQVKENELPQIHKAYTAAAIHFKQSAPAKCKLTAIVVAKRHHVRFMPQAKDKVPNGNCKPGTLVDQGVTSPMFQDFYLQSHHSLQGSAKSAHYFVLVNEIGATEKQVQNLTHKLCYAYARATAGVSYAPPSYYADRLCERGRCYLRDFLAPGPNSLLARRRLEFKNKLLKDFKDAREAKFEPSRKLITRNGENAFDKTAEERIQEYKDRDEVEKQVRKLTFEKAKEAFYKDPTAPNPFHKNLADTMFWM
ncbi:Piwi domain-containing protein [Paraphoma chrysanthemicola]|uniref:Piwi domain-containing protein n=1 Tax=Paraphoma chrysanthemicola TaxID=798071 RepID=A0A8K0RG73_9PLEO|nr:Piwi domain-containing protein [Paraphoma chrysanthemicola]